MRQSPEIKNLLKALLSAQRKIENVTKDANNPFFKSKYATLEQVMDGCKKPLNDAGITIIQAIESREHGDYLVTMLAHSDSGEFVTSEMKLIMVKNDMQSFGSAVSYARRYSLQSMAFLTTTDDDDGERAVGRTTTPVIIPKGPIQPTKTQVVAPTISLPALSKEEQEADDTRKELLSLAEFVANIEKKGEIKAYINGIKWREIKKAKPAVINSINNIIHGDKK